MKAAIVSPSAPSTFSAERIIQYRKGLDVLASSGIDCLVMPHAENAMDYAADTVENRLADLHAAYADPDIDIIIAANGGRVSGQLLLGLDYGLIKKHPKPLVGFSDISVLSNAIHAKTGQVQIHGPMVTWGFAEEDELTLRCFRDAIEKRSSELPMARFGKFLRGDKLEGKMLGGNLASVETLLGTPFEPDWDGAVFFWEETEEPVSRVDRMLTHFKNAGVWDRIGGMVIGRLDRLDGKFGETETEPLQLVMGHFAPYAFPILKTDLFGHGTKLQISLPVGGSIKVVNESINLGF